MTSKGMKWILGAGFSAMLGLAGATATLAQNAVEIGGVLYARDSQSWLLAERGMKDAAEKNGAGIVIGLSQRQLATEAQVVEDMVTRGVKAIVIFVLDAKASAAVLLEAKSKGVVIVEDGTHLADKTVAHYSVGVDQSDLAREVAGQMREHIKGPLGGKAKVGFLFLPPQNPQSTARNGAAQDAVKELDVTVVAEVVAFNPETGATAAEQILQREPETQIIYAANGGAAEGAAAALKRAGSKAIVYGFDLSVLLANNLLAADGNVMAIADQDLYNIAYLGAEAGIRAAKNEMTGPREIRLPAKLYTRETVQQTRDFIDLANSVAANK